MPVSTVLYVLACQETLHLLAFCSYSGHVKLVMKDYHLQISPPPPFIIPHLYLMLHAFQKLIQIHKIVIQPFFSLSLCSLLNKYQVFGGYWYPHLQGKRPETGKPVHNTRMGGPKIYRSDYWFPSIYPQHHSQHLPLYHHSL
jgi:hypothetical protein